MIYFQVDYLRDVGCYLCSNKKKGFFFKDIEKDFRFLFDVFESDMRVKNIVIHCRTKVP